MGRAHLKFAILVAVIAAGLGVSLLALPHLLDADSLRKKMTGRIAAWTGAEVTVSGPTRLSYFPFVVMEMRNVRIERPQRLAPLGDIRARAVRVEFAPWSIVTGDPVFTRLVLAEPVLHLSPSETATHPSSLAAALQGVPIARLSVLDGRIAVGADENSTAADDLNADLSFSAAGALEGSVHFTWRGQPVNVVLESTAPAIRGDAVHAPLRLTVSSPHLSGTLAGQASLAENLQLHGSLDLQGQDLRAFAAWMGLPVPSGRGLGPFSASGRVNWRSDRIAIDEGSFILDGNQALGALAIDFFAPRPSLTGTLALQDFGLSQYYLTPTGQKAFGELDPALLRLVDLDLRLSTAQVDVRPFLLGQTALSLRLKEGRLAADFSILSFCGGQADGRFEMQIQDGVPHLQLAARADSIVIKPCVELFARSSPIEGMPTIELDLIAHGRTTADLLSSLRGDATLSMSSGSTTIDFAKLLLQARQGDLHGWKSARGNSTRFDSLSSQCSVLNGIMHCRNVRMATGIAEITGEGSLSLASGELDWRLRLADTVAGPLPRLGSLLNTSALRVKGPWSEPTFRLAPSNASGRHFEDSHRFAMVPLWTMPQ